MKRRMITQKQIRNFEYYMIQEEKSPLTIQKYLRDIRHFLSFSHVEMLNKELSKAEYFLLVQTANRNENEKLSLIMQTLCSSGRRVSELQFITVEAIRKGEVTINCKGKLRTIFILDKMKKKLLKYAKKNHINSGAVFVTKSGKPVNRSNIWREMKKLCKNAGVSPEKVFPHNLRHLFARIFYELEKDIAKFHYI